MTDTEYETLKNELWLKWSALFQYRGNEKLLEKTIYFLEEYSKKVTVIFDDLDELEEMKCVSLIKDSLNMYLKHHATILDLKLTQNIICEFLFRDEPLQYNDFLEVSIQKTKQREDRFTEKQMIETVNGKRAYNVIAIENLTQKLYELEEKMNSPRGVNYENVSVSSSKNNPEDKMINLIQRKIELENAIKKHQNLFKELDNLEKEKELFYQKNKEKYTPISAGNYVISL